MNQQIRIPSLRVLLRVETLLLLLLLAGAVAGVYLYRQANDARAETERLEKALTSARNGLRDWRAANNPDDIKKEIERLKSTPISGVLPSRQEVFGLSAKLAALAVERQLNLKTADVLTGSVSVAGTQYRSITYSITMDGKAEALLAALNLVDGYPTATVKTLKLQRGSGDQWAMTLEITLVHA